MNEKMAVEILELCGNYNKDDVKKNYRMKCRQYHPDKLNGNNDKMMLINLAYDFMLSNIDIILNGRNVIINNIVHEDNINVFYTDSYAKYLLNKFGMDSYQYKKYIEIIKIR